MNITWEDPPRQSLMTRSFSDLIIKELQTQPGKWARVYEQEEGVTPNAARGRGTTLKSYGYRHGLVVEVLTRTVVDRVVVYARVVE